jgi:hypothetical protein
LELPKFNKLASLKLEELKNYFDFISKADLSLELFRSKLNGNFTFVYLWPDSFDLSTEWFTGPND